MSQSEDIVRIWEETVTIPTYEVGAPDKNPMFFEKRVYQGSSGAVYPNPVIEKIYDEKVDKEYAAVFLENKYLKIMILPEIGGRVQMAFDKIKQRHFVYYNQVIKPALVGLTGPWISGGIEFNWPQHHRPSTFEKVDHRLEENADGSKTIWVNEVEKMFGTKGMAGFTLYPGKAYLEIHAQIYNRSSLPQTFLWWANPAVSVNDHYQSVFPSDVNAVFDHGKRDVSTFPIATGTYYKVDYSPGTDISRYKNIPVPTSYMAVNSEYDFVGGYEHDTRAGLLHVADHHVSPGKKQWTWGHGDFGQAWDRNLTDEDGPYIELMTGMFTDNQPDFTWLMPYEEKSFKQYFLPYRELGVVKNATKDILLGLETDDNAVTVKVYATSNLNDIQIVLCRRNEVIFEIETSISPETTFSHEISLEFDIEITDFKLIAYSKSGKELIRFEPSKNKKKEIPEAAKAALLPQEVENCEQLFLTGQHLEQYRHATYSPVPYYEEALKRDPGDIRNNNALGLWYLRRGRFAISEAYFRNAIDTQTSRNPNPYEGEAYYNLGLCLHYQKRFDEAYAAFYKAAWSAAWQDVAYFSLARIDLMRGDDTIALEHINFSLDRNARNSKSYVLKSATLRRLGRLEDAMDMCNAALVRDGFNLGILFEKHLIFNFLGNLPEAESALETLISLARGEVNNYIEYARDYAFAGLYTEAINLLKIVKEGFSNPIYWYHLAEMSFQANEIENVKAYLEKAASLLPGTYFPNKLEDIIALQLAIEMNPKDAYAPYYLGNIWYDKKQYEEAIKMWEVSVDKNPDFPTSYRNLGIAYFNKNNQHEKALSYYEKAFSLDEADARVLMELDQLYKRLNYDSQIRLQFLEDHYETVLKRDDLYLEFITLKNLLNQYQSALDLLNERQFHPWEGGEGKVSGQYIYSLIELAKENIAIANYEQAIEQLTGARSYPYNLGEGKLPDAQENDILYWLGFAYENLGEQESATNFFEQATKGNSQPAAAIFYNDQQPDKIFYQGLAFRKLGNRQKAIQIFSGLVSYGEAHINDHVTIDYFAVSLPDLLIFDSDLNQKNKQHCQFLIGLGLLGLEDFEGSREAFEKVLIADSAHSGAKTHLELLDIKVGKN